MNLLALIKIELQSRLRTILTWSITWSLVVYLFSYLFSNMAFDQVGENIFEIIPEGIMAAVNIDLNYFTKIEYFLGGQFSTLYMLSASVFSIFMGSNILGKRIADKTILQLLTKGLSRKQIYFGHFIVNSVVVFLTSTFTMIGSYLIVSITAAEGTDVSLKFFVALFTAMFILKFFFFNLGQMLGVALDSSKAVSIGIVFAFSSWLINGISTMEGFPSWLKYFSPFNYANLPHITKNFAPDVDYLLCLFVASEVIMIIGTVAFTKKDIHI